MKQSLLVVALCCSACNLSVTEANDSAPAPQGEERSVAQAAVDPYAFTVQPEPAGVPPRVDSILQAQVALDRAGFSPGVLDGKEGMSFTKALTGFQQARGLTPNGKYDEATAKVLLGDAPPPATWIVQVPEGFARGPFAEIPKGLNEQAKLPALSYRNLLEKLAERFHTTPEALVALNQPGTRVGAGANIRVPAIANQPVAWQSRRTSLRPITSWSTSPKGCLRSMTPTTGLSRNFRRPPGHSMIPCRLATGR